MALDPLFYVSRSFYDCHFLGRWQAPETWMRSEFNCFRRSPVRNYAFTYSFATAHRKCFFQSLIVGMQCVLDFRRNILGFLRNRLHRENKAKMVSVKSRSART
jgi:hypothetical protein